MVHPLHRRSSTHPNQNPRRNRPHYQLRTNLVRTSTLITASRGCNCGDPTYTFRCPFGNPTRHFGQHRDWWLQDSATRDGGAVTVGGAHGCGVVAGTGNVQPDAVFG